MSSINNATLQIKYDARLSNLDKRIHAYVHMYK